MPQATGQVGWTTKHKFYKQLKCILNKYSESAD